MNVLFKKKQVGSRQRQVAFFLFYLQNRVVELPVGDHYCRVQNINNADCNSVCVNYYQLGPATLKQDVIDDLMVVSINYFLSCNL